MAYSVNKRITMLRKDQRKRAKKKGVGTKISTNTFFLYFYNHLNFKAFELYSYFCPNPAPPTAACAAAKRAIGTLNGEQDT